MVNMIANNKDDHSKNFSFLMNENGTWNLAPASDLTYALSSHGCQSTTVDGKSKSITYKDFQNLAKLFSVKHIDHIYDQVLMGLNTFKDLAYKFDVPRNTRNQVLRDIEFNIAHF